MNEIYLEMNFTRCSHSCKQMSLSGSTASQQQEHEASVGTGSLKLNG